MAAKGIILGIDLGTTNSCMAAIQQVDLTVLPSAEGGRTTPSVVAFTAADRWFAGQTARQQMAANPTNTLYAIRNRP